MLATFSARLRRGQSDEAQLQAAASALDHMPFMRPRGLLDDYARYNQVISEVAQETGALLIEGEDHIPGDAERFTDAGSRKLVTDVSRAVSANDIVARLGR